MARRTTLALCPLALLAAALSVPACGGEDGVFRLDQFRSDMAAYDGKVSALFTDLIALADATQAMKVPLARGDMKAVDAAHDRLATAATGLLSDARALEDLEYRLRDGQEPRSGTITRPLLVIGLVAVIAGTYAFARKMKQLSDEMSRQRKARDDAMARLARGDKTALDDVAAAKKKMTETGGKAITELATKVSSELVTTPIKTATAGGVILKETASRLYEKGVKVLAATKPCATAPASASCRIDVQRTDAQGRVPAPAGEQTLLVSHPGKARIAVTGVMVAKGKDTVVVRPRIPVSEATPKNTEDNDAGRYTPPGEPPPPGRGPKCAKLAACCAKVKNSAYLESECKKILARNIELHCGTLLISIRLPYGCDG